MFLPIRIVRCGKTEKTFKTFETLGDVFTNFNAKFEEKQAAVL